MSTPNMKALAHRLTAARTQRRWTQSDLARKAGVSPSYVSRLEQAVYTRPSNVKMSAIAQALRMKLTDLTNEPDDASPDDLGAAIRTAFGGDARKIEDFFYQTKDLDRSDLEFVLATVEWLGARMEAARSYHRTRALLTQP